MMSLTMRTTTAFINGRVDGKEPMKQKYWAGLTGVCIGVGLALHSHFEGEWENLGEFLTVLGFFLSLILLLGGFKDEA